jgi:outer membrane protein TolC
MNYRKNFFLVVCAVSLVGFVSPLSAGTLQDLFTAATKSNQDYSVYQLTFELAGLKQTKGEIEAQVEQDRVQAQYDYSAATSTYWNGVLSFYDKVIDAIFDAGNAEISYQSYILSLQNAQEDMNSAEARYKNGLISEDTYKEIVISYNTAQNNLQLAEFTLSYAKSNVKFVTGLDWKSDLIPGLPSFEAKASLDEWMAKDISLEEANLYKKLNDLKTNALATNTPMYDRRIQETDNAKAAVEITKAENNAKRSYEEVLSTISNDAAVIKIRQDEYALKASLYQQAQTQYDKGTISLSAMNNKQIDVYAAQGRLLSAQQAYLKSIASYQTAIRENPLGL